MAEKENVTIHIKNENLAQILMMKLGKEKNEFSVQDLLKIKTIVINADPSIKDNAFVDFDILKYSKELKEIVLANMDVHDFILEDMACLDNLEKVIFDNCNIISEDELKGLKVKRIELLNTKISNFLVLEKMPNLRNIVLTENLYNVNIDNINKLAEKSIKSEVYNCYTF